VFSAVIHAVAADKQYHITVSSSAVSMKVGDVKILSISVNLPSGDRLSIKSSHPNAVLCERSGSNLILSAKAAGKAEITIKSKNTAISPAVISVSVSGSYKVTFDSNGAAPAPKSFEVVYGQKCTIGPEKPELAGHVFQGWAIGGDTSVLYQSGGVYDLTKAYQDGGCEDLVLEAVWNTSYYSVTYYSNTTDAVENIPANNTKLAYGDLVKIPDTKPFSPGYKFLGWATDSGGAVTYKPGDSFKIEKSVALYAVWEKNEVKFSNPALVINKAKTASASLTITIRGTCSFYRISAVKGVTYTWGTRVGNTIPLKVDVAGVASNKAKVVKTIHIRTYDINKKLIADSSFTVTIKNIKAPKVTVKKNKSGTTTLKWKKVTGAQKYRVLISANKKFTKFKTKTVKKGTSVTFKKTASKKYYKVCAVRKSYTGVFSKIKSF
jgi:hypothetical protein